jgi:hypothetical protein
MESLTERVGETLDNLKPRLEDVAEGYAELVEVDEGLGIVKVRLIDGRLH